MQTMLLRKCRLIHFAINVSLLILNDFACGLKLFVNTTQHVGSVNHFWKSTGFSPPSPHIDAYSQDLAHNLALIAAIPQGGVGQVRIHWLLDLITISSQSSVPVYNFTHLDSLLDFMWELGLKPGFELMGNPSSLFHSFDDKKSVYMWKDLVAQTAKRYIDTYGLGYVSTWNFESWNEPEGHHFDDINITVQGYLNYYDACSQGLNEASPLLILGGPAGDDSKKTKYTDAFLDHVAYGHSYFDGKTPRLDFLSFHKKGKGLSRTIIDDEVALMKNITDRYPSLSNIPFFNDEADPLVGWSKDEVWRADASYAAMVAKVIVQHQYAFFTNKSPLIKNYTLLSNDNGFLSWYPHQFTQRTLLARFQMNTTSPSHTQFFQKPVYSVMGLLALLGEIQVKADILDISGDQVLDEELGVLATVHDSDIPGTSDSWQTAILVYLSNDTGPETGNRNLDIFVDLQPPASASSDLTMALWLVDNAVTNPYQIWKSAGKPAYPSLEVIRRMRQMEGSQLLYTQSVQAGYQQVARIDLQEPAVLLVHICSNPGIKPDQVNNVNVFNITSGQVLITWSDKCVNSRCLLKYEVVFSKDGSEGSFTTITPPERCKHETSFTYVTADYTDEMVRGYYKVRAIDYFSHAGEYSLPTQYPDNTSRH